MRLNGWLTRAGFLLLMTACGGPGASLPVLLPGSTAYHLGPGDQIRVITLGDDQMTGAFRVNDSGAIALPMLRRRARNGASPAELEQGIAHALTQAQLIHSPSISVEVTTYRPIFVLGEVNHPGEFPSAWHDW